MMDAEIESVRDGVVRMIAEALVREIDEVHLDSRLIDDLGAESIDFLDIVFRLEQLFRIEIPRGKITEDARGTLSEEEFAHDGYLTPEGLIRLRNYLDEVPADRFPPRLRVAEVPRLFTVETFCKVVVRALREAKRKPETRNQ
jgi:acyl carrier protein